MLPTYQGIIRVPKTFYNLQTDFISPRLLSLLLKEQSEKNRHYLRLFEVISMCRARKVGASPQNSNFALEIPRHTIYSVGKKDPW